MVPRNIDIRTSQLHRPVPEQDQAGEQDGQRLRDLLVEPDHEGGEERDRAADVQAVVHVDRHDVDPGQGPDNVDRRDGGFLLAAAGTDQHPEAHAPQRRDVEAVRPPRTRQVTGVAEQRQEDQREQRVGDDEQPQLRALKACSQLWIGNRIRSAVASPSPVSPTGSAAGGSGASQLAQAGWKAAGGGGAAGRAAEAAGAGGESQTAPRGRRRGRRKEAKHRPVRRAKDQVERAVHRDPRDLLAVEEGSVTSRRSQAPTRRVPAQHGLLPGNEGDVRDEVIVR